MQEQRNTPGLIDRIESEAVDTIHPILQWILDNLKLLGLAAALLLLTVAGYSGFAYYQERARTEAQNRLGVILAQNQGPELISGLQEYIGSESHYRTKALFELAQAQMETGQYAAAAASWDQLARTKQNDLRTVALMGKARALGLGGSPAESLALLLNLRDSAPAPFVDNLQLQIAETAESAGELKTALTAYEALRQSAQDEANAAFYDYKIVIIKDQIG